MKLKKRKKFSRARGTRLMGYAAKKHKGSGNKGGKGMAGTGKRAGQKRTYVLRYLHPYFGRKARIRERKLVKKKSYNEINLRDLEKNIENLMKKGFGKETKEGIEINLEDYKILGEGELKLKLIVKASSFTQSAKEKIEKAGGKIIEGEKVTKEKKKIGKVEEKKEEKTAKKPESKKKKVIKK